MARLTTERKAQVVGALVEGSSIRSVERMTGIHRDTILKLVTRMGKASERLLEERIRGVHCEQLQLDEVWCFVGKKRRSIRASDNRAEVGDFWCWVALDPDSKLIPSHLIGKRTWREAQAFAKDLRSRVEGRVQLSTDKLLAYRAAIWGEFSERREDGSWDRPDWGTIVKRYAVEPAHDGRYSPPKVVGVKRRVESGSPDPGRISTSHVERAHLTQRMQMRRFTRLTNGFSKKADNLRAATALHFAHYNFVRRHGSIKTTPAVAAGLEDRAMTLTELVEWGELYGR